MIYFDNASTTPIDTDVLNAMMPYLTEEYGNPSSLHSIGRKARTAVERAREQCSKALNCQSDEIFFTSGATEGNNWAVLNNNCDMDVLPIDHKSLINNCYTTLEVDKNGVVLKESIMDAVNNSLSAIGIALVNSELGVMQPIADICHWVQPPSKLHIDATQAVGKIDIDLKKWSSVTTLSLSGHKIGAPKGVGLMFIRREYQEFFSHMYFGGGQERGMRAGTENVAGIVGLGAAMQMISRKEIMSKYIYVGKLKNRFIRGLSRIPCVRFNALCSEQLPYYLSVSFKGIEGESLMLNLDNKGICVSTGSACNSGNLEASSALTAIGVPSDYINGTIRISLSERNTMEEVEKAVSVIRNEVSKLRKISPTWHYYPDDKKNII